MAGFDEKSKEYDAWYDTTLGAFIDARETECTFALLPHDVGAHILDCGCGTGRFSLKLAMQGFQVEGIDLSEPMLAHAREKARIAECDINFRKMDICCLDYADNTFDAVVSVALFEFIHDDKKALEECFRVVKPGGYVLIGTITKDSSWGEAYLQHMHREDSVFHQAKFKTRAEMKSFFADRRLAVRECAFTGPDAPLHALTLENEARLSRQVAGGFICLLWQKPIQGA